MTLSGPRGEPGERGRMGRSPSAQGLAAVGAILLLTSALIALSLWVSIHNTTTLREALRASCYVRNAQIDAMVARDRQLIAIERRNTVEERGVTAARIFAYTTEADALNRLQVNCERQFR